MMRGTRSARVSAGVVDQALSSASNALFLVALARVAPVEEFGELSIVLLVVTALLGTMRGLVGVRLSMLGGDRASLADEGRFALGAAVLAGAVASTGGLATSLALELSAAAVVLSLAPLFALGQDVLRYAAVAAGRAGQAVVSDGVWALASVAALGWTVANRDSGALVPSLLWVGGAALAFGCLLSTARVLPRCSGLVPWLRRDYQDHASFGVEGAISSFYSVVVMLIITAVLGLGATAAIRGAGVIIGPLSLLMSSLALVVVPELARSGAGSTGSALWGRLRWVGVVVCVAALAVGSVGLWLPAAIGEALLGDTWSSARRILPILGVEYASLAWMYAGDAGLRALGAGRRLLRIRLAYSLVSLVVVFVGAQLDDVRYVSMGLAGTAAVFAWVCVRALRGTGPRPARVVDVASSG